MDARLAAPESAPRRNRQATRAAGRQSSFGRGIVLQGPGSWVARQLAVGQQQRFVGWRRGHLVALMYTAFRRIDPTMETGTDFAAEYEAAMKLQQTSSSGGSDRASSIALQRFKPALSHQFRQPCHQQFLQRRVLSQREL